MPVLPIPTIAPAYLTIRQTCDELHVSRMTLYRFLGRPLPDGLPFSRFGRAVRISREDLEAFKRARRVAGAVDDTGAA